MELSVTFGEVVRNMVKQALRSEDMAFEVSTAEIVAIMRGCHVSDLPAEVLAKPREYVKQIKNSYITTTAARMSELRDLDLRVKSEFHTYAIDEFVQIEEIEGPDGKPMDFNVHPDINKNDTEFLRIKLVKGAMKLGGRGSRDEAKDLMIKRVQRETIQDMIRLVNMTSAELTEVTDDDKEMIASAKYAKKVKQNIVKAMQSLTGGE